MPIQAVFFDMGGTIETLNYDSEMRLRAVPGMRALLLAAGIKLNLTDKEFLDVFTIQYQKYHSWRKISQQELPTWQIWTDFILADFPEYNEPVKAIAEGLTLYYETQFYHREMRPEMPVVLEAIQQMGLKMGVISNVTSKGQVPVNLEKYNLLHYFSPIILSSVYGRRKPDPAIFHYAARMANVPTSRCLYVGDRIARDIEGARRAGYALAIQIVHNFDHGEDDSGAQPDAIIHNMTALIDILLEEKLRPPTGPVRPRNRSIRAILFDAGDVLYYRGERRKLSAFLKELGLIYADSESQERTELRDKAYQGEITQDEYREGFLRLLGVRDSEQITRGKLILEEEDNDIQFFAGIPETLHALKKRGFLLGIITDTAHSVSTKLNWFKRGGVGDVWDTIISSKELGVRKPKPEIYHAALTHLGIKAAEAVFIGHNTSELNGASVVGMKTIAFNYDEDAKADCYIQGFSELLTLSFLATG